MHVCYTIGYVLSESEAERSGGTVEFGPGKDPDIGVAIGGDGIGME